MVTKNIGKPYKIRECIHCGATYDTGLWKQLYCTAICRHAAFDKTRSYMKYSTARELAETVKEVLEYVEPGDISHRSYETLEKFVDTFIPKQ